MKTPKIFLFVGYILLFLLNNNCNKNWISKITCHGYVSHQNGTPAEGVWVYLSACNAMSEKDECDNYIVGQAKSDATGYYFIHDDAAMSDRYCLSLKLHECYSINTSKSTLEYGENNLEAP